MKNLRSLQLNSNKLFKGTHDIELVCEIFKSFSKIQKLSMHENSISESDFKELAFVFAKYKNLKHLNLSRNNMTENSIQHFVK